MAKQQTALQVWRRAILSDDGPPEPNTRYVLLALAQYMDADGSGAFPSLDRLALDTRLTRRTVGTHIQLAKDAGWLVTSNRGSSRGWRRYQYEAALP